MNETDDTTAAFERTAKRSQSPKVELRLFIAGMGPRSTQAVADLKRLRAEFGERCSVEIVDIYERPAAAIEAQVIAVPALVRCSPLPVRKLIGSIGNLASAARSLGLPPRQAGSAA